MNDKAVRAVRDFLAALGIDLAAEGMERTPERVAKMYELLFNGRGVDTAGLWGERFQTESNGIIVVRQIPFYSMCEHHLVPFFGEVHIAYLPHGGEVAGFSKFAKLVEVISHRPQLQERMTKQIADAIARDLGADGVMVMAEAEQLCMTMRGDLAHGTRILTTECNGCLHDDQELYRQAWMLLGRKGDK